MEDRLFVSLLCFPLLLADFVNYLISLFIKPAVFLVNLFTEFSVGFIYLGLQLAALLINFVTLFSLAASRLNSLSASSSFLSSSSSSFLIFRSHTLQSSQFSKEQWICHPARHCQHNDFYGFTKQVGHSSLGNFTCQRKFRRVLTESPASEIFTRNRQFLSDRLTRLFKLDPKKIQLPRFDRWYWRCSCSGVQMGRKKHQRREVA